MKIREIAELERQLTELELRLAEAEEQKSEDPRPQGHGPPQPPTEGVDRYGDF